ncbi:MAG: bifunctional glutamate N-acetyltransferase/amino-acid acetyltransferase ArgJ [Planctomycetaceae bacterium]|nr:bifunctional glutamate N-acetyltransferase/amino-acid acetyltransferase ArgJ [Planctomycetaceae bacterium]
MSDVTLPLGYSANGISCGVKNDPSKLDLALFVSDRPAVAAGVFTQNKVCGAPVKVSRSRVPRETARAVVINSGNSNACTGDRGIADAEAMTAAVGKLLGTTGEDVLVCSTGVIGRFLPMEKLQSGIAAIVPTLGASVGHFNAAARAMMTTDTFAKEVSQQVDAAGGCRVYGCAKGAAMIAPNMATMLSVILTDACLTREQADRILRHAVSQSFNCVSVEGHTSTSDTVLLLANGAASPGKPVSGEAEAAVARAIDEVASQLAQLIIRDAEGADHFITIDVRGTRTRDEARTIAKAIAEGPLVKTAITGADPNWGRIISAAGYCGVELKEEDMSLRVNGTPLYERGAPVAFDAAAVSASIKNNRDVSIELTLTLGSESIRFWTSDLTCEYVRLNADYTT